MDDDWNELNALRGLSPRQQRLLHLEALVEGTGYAELRPWESVDANGVPLPCCERAPGVQIGILAEKVTKLVRRLSGSGSFPSLDGVEPIQEAVDQLRLARTFPLPTRDVVVKGSGVLGFARLGDAQTGRFEPLYIDTTWCEPIFVAHASGRRAKQIAEELGKLGVTLAPGDSLDADSHDLIFLRHEWVLDEEIAALEGGSARETVRTRHRRDYLPNVIVEYEPVTIRESDTTAPEWKLASPPRPHNWGVVPFVWCRSPGAKPGDIDGPSFVTPELESIARAADYTESMATDSVKKIAWPQLALIDLKDKVDSINRELDPMGRPGAKSSSSGEVMDLKSSHPSLQGKAQILEINGQGPKVAAEHIERLKGHADRLTGMVDFDPATAGGVMSGVALERMMESLISTVEEYRGALDDALVLLLRKVGKVLRKEGVEPTARWPRVVAVTPSDLAAAAQALSVATGGQPVVSQETAAKIWAQLAEIEDVPAELARLKKDADEAMQQAREAMSARPRPDAEPAEAA